MKIKRYTQRYLSGNGEVWVEFCCIICISGLLFLCEMSSYVHSSIWCGPVYWVECMILNIWAEVVEKELCCGEAVDLKLSEDLHFCNDSISADVTNILFWQMLSYPWLTTTYCYFRRYYIVRWNNTTTQIQLVTYKSPIKRSTWSWNKKKKDHLTVQRLFQKHNFLSKIWTRCTLTGVSFILFCLFCSVSSFVFTSYLIKKTPIIHLCILLYGFFKH